MSLLSPQLDAFLAIAEQKTVHAAAQQLHLTQTAVTQRIRSLEKQLKAALFIRSRRGMLLTAEGEALLRYCHASKELEGEALAIIKGAGKAAEVELTISAPSSIMRSRVIPQCITIMQAFPNLLIHFDTDDLEQRHHKLRSGKADFAIITEDQLAREMQFKPLQPEQYLLVGSAKWQHRSLTDIIAKERIVDFDPTDQMTLDYLRHYRLLELATQHGRYFANRTEHIALLVANEVGYTTLDQEFVKPYVDSKQIAILNNGKAYNFSPVLAWFARPNAADYFSQIIAAMY